jgi:hypothetical protein
MFFGLLGTTRCNFAMICRDNGSWGQWPSCLRRSLLCFFSSCRSALARRDRFFFFFYRGPNRLLAAQRRMPKMKNGLWTYIDLYVPTSYILEAYLRIKSRDREVCIPILPSASYGFKFWLRYMLSLTECSRHLSYIQQTNSVRLVQEISTGLLSDVL